jgi:uncharacterized protein (TIGR02594 family)
MSVASERALWHALGELGVTEEGAPNRGPEVDVYLRTVGLDPTRAAFPWCAAFVYWCFFRAATDLGSENPCPKTASVMKLWAKTQQKRTTRPAPGDVMIMDHGAGRGHCGIVLGVGARHVVTVDGNTNGWGSREGDQVAVRTRYLHDVLGFVSL